jgi:hypothetical protein
MAKTVVLLLLYITLYATNHLKNEPSPYLQQHKNNPVDWYPWGKEAFAKAKKEHKLIFLSIGYSTCHWCHVMARENFEDKEVATLLNRFYVSIKVDKEEYPQIDAYYQRVYKKLHKKGGGWPLNLILTPEKKTLFAATYIPKYASYNSEGMLFILKHFTTLSSSKQQNYLNKNTRLLRDKTHIHTSQNIQNLTNEQILKQFSKLFDTKNKGFGTHPKFPHPSMIKTLLNLYQITHNTQALEMAIQTLTAMAQSGLYDQVDGGFFRYCIDKKWQIPHFEKMLYSNAELIEVYTLAYTITKNPLYKKVLQESISMVERYFLEDGLYKSASNAESKNLQGDLQEGYYFLFQYDTTLEYLTQHKVSLSHAKEALAYLGIEEDGNIDGELSNPHITQMQPPQNINIVIKLLHDMRTKRAYPFIDYKRNTAWNALYISAKLKSSFINENYQKEALTSLQKLLTCNMKDGVLYHTSIANQPLRTEGVLEDYAFVIEALLMAYEKTLQKHYLTQAIDFFQKAQQKFYKNAQWYLSDDTLHVSATMKDTHYKSALASLMQSALFLSSVSTQTHNYFLVEELLQNISQHLTNSAPYYATALQLFFQKKYGIFLIKSNKHNLKPLLYKDFTYPFVYLYAKETTHYELCGARSCYAQEKKLEPLLHKLQKIIVRFYKQKEQ